jgi:hypothetical protein
MANARYGYAWQQFLQGNIDWATGNFKVALVTSGYVPNFSTDQFLSVVGSGNIVATSSNLSSLVAALFGVASAANVTFSLVSGSTATYILIYQDTGNPATSPLLILIDTATNLPVTPNGGSITINWNAAGIFTL